MKIAPEIFRAYDIRGIVETALTPDAVRAIGRAFGSEALEAGCPRVVIGRDGRLSSPVLAEALADGLRAAGCEVIDIGLVPTPVLYYATHRLETGTGIMITGSHNPPEYNGLKMMIGGVTLAAERIQALRERIERDDFKSGAGAYREENVVDDYVARIAADVRLARPMRFAVDAGNGAAGPTALKLFEALGQSPLALYCEVDGRFPNHHPDPSKPENLAELRAAVKRERLELGLAFDGDGDRLGVVDEAGDIVWPDRQMILYARDILARHPGAPIVFDVKCSKHLIDAIRAAGGQPIMSRTGHSFIKATLKETGAPLGGEMSGHIFFKDRWYGFDDGLYTAARLLELLSRESASPREVFAKLPSGVSTPELNVPMEEGAHHAFIGTFQRQARFEDAQLTLIDGVRADFPDGWGLVRASNTTPVLVLRFEGDTPEALARIQAAFREQMLRIDPTLKLPF